MADNAGGEVSSTTTDMDLSHETIAKVLEECKQEPAQSSTMDDSLGDFGEDGFEPPVAEASSSKPSASAFSSSFQSAFAAFASASQSYSDTEQLDNSLAESSISDTDLAADSVVASSTSTEAIAATNEPLVSSAIDSTLVTTTEDSTNKTFTEVDSNAILSGFTQASSSVTEYVQPQGVSENSTQDNPNFLHQTPIDSTQAESSLQEPVTSQPLSGNTAETQIDTPVIQEQTSVSYTQQITDNSLVPAEQNQSLETTDPAAIVSEPVFFIQLQDTSGEIVTSVIDPNDIAAYADSIVYRQCMRADGQVETTIVTSAGVPAEQQQQVTQEAAEPQQEVQQQVIYAHDENGQLTPIDSAQSANDVAPPGKQFVYMQDSTGRIIRTIMNADQTMVPGQQVYYTQSEDGQVITSVMDSASAGVTEQDASNEEQQNVQSQGYHQTALSESLEGKQAVTTTSMVTDSSGFSIDNSMSGLSMLAELSHLTSGQATSSTLPELKTTSSTDSSNSQDPDMEEFRPVAMVTRKIGGNGEDSLHSDLSSLHVGDGPKESIISKLISGMKCGYVPPAQTVSKDNLFVQWQNLDAMCWMDVVLVMLVYSPTLRQLVNMDPNDELNSTLLITLLKANRQAQVLLQNLLKKNGGSEITGLQLGAGNTVSMSDPKTSKLVSKENMDEIGKAINILYSMRERIWQALQPRLRCERGKHNSPVLVLPLLVREKPVIKQMFTMNYRYVFKCEQCGYSQDDSHSKILPTIPAVPDDFNMKSPYFERNCFECQAPNQRMLMKFEGLQDFVQMHFVKGLPHNRFDELSFDFNGDFYEVSAVVHYKNNPDHFIAWVRNAPGPYWMECDDLKSVITRYLPVLPNIPPNQVHMVMWERRLTPQHTLVMRDTEDTRVLASLVLTVQQPTSHMANTDTPGIPKTTAPTPVTGTGSTGLSTASSLLSGLMNQNQTFAPYTRGRGRGRGRGSRGGRGRGVTTTYIKQQANTVPGTPAPASNIQLTTPRTPTSYPRPSAPQTPKILRLPMSALANSGMNLRGSSASSGATRLVLMNNNSQSGTAAGGTANKVIMVRSQGGSINNLSPQQLLQLLQRSGAINQSNSNVKVKFGNGSETTLSGVTAPAVENSAQSEIPAEGQSLLTPSIESSVTETSEMPMETADEGQTTITTTDPSHYLAAPPLSSSDDVSNTLVTSSFSSTNPDNPIVLSPDSGSRSNLGSVTSSSASLTIASDQQQQLASTTAKSRYISIPNPNGPGNILTQLVLRDGKMVLVPVNKNVTTQDTASSVLRLPGSTSAGGSPSVSIRVPKQTSLASSLLSTVSTPSMNVSAGQSSISTLTSSLPYGKLSSLATPATSVNTTTSTSAVRYVTIPDNSGSGVKRTIQLISLPKSTASAVSGQGNQKTILVNPSGAQSDSQTSYLTSLMTQADSQQQNSEQQTLSQQSEIQDLISNATMTSTATPMMTDSGAQTPTMLRQELLSTPASSTLSFSPNKTSNSSRISSLSGISLLRDISRSTQDSTSSQVILGSSPGTTSTTLSPEENQESFRYILPGSSTSVLQTGVSGSLQNGGKSFTALSSSGTIIGGQLTPANPSSSVDPDLITPEEPIIEDGGDQTGNISLLSSPSRATQDMDIDYIPLGARGRGRGSRGRGRGGRTARGRGRSQVIWSTSDLDLISSSSYVTTPSKASALSDLRQIGAQRIDSNTEAVDGVPVVSIPEFNESVAQPESAVVTQSLPGANETGVDSVTSSVGTLQTDALSLLAQQSLVHDLSNSPQSQEEGPRVITQTIPSIKANHGFDILTQGIGLTSGANVRQTLTKPGRSLLTGTPTKVLPVSSTVSADISLLTSVASKAQASLSMGHSVSQAEIETLIQAADAAAKPAKLAGSSLLASTLASIGPNEASPIAQQVQTELVPSELGVQEEEMPTSEYNKEEPEATEEEERIVNVDESKVSAAERYRMPMELFQPDEESPEKPMRSEVSVGALDSDMPASIFQDAETEIMEEQMEEGDLPANSCEQTSSVEKIIPVTDEQQVSQPVEDHLVDVESAEENILSSSIEEDESLISKAKQRKRGRPKGRQGRKKSHSTSSASGWEESENNSASRKMPEPVSPVKHVHDNEIENQLSPIPLKTKNIGGFATDLLSDTEDAQETSQEIESEKTEVVEQTEVVKQPELIPEETDNLVSEEKDISLSKDSDDIEVDVSMKDEEEEMEESTGEMEDDDDEDIYLPAVVLHPKRKTVWLSESDEEGEEEEDEFPRRPINYKELCGKLRKPCQRHASLGTLQASYTRAPSPFEIRERKETKNSDQQLKAVVVRQCPKSLQYKPSKTQSLISLPIDSEACIGGSKVSSSLMEHEMYYCVIVKQRKQIADWSSYADDPHEDLEADKELEDEEFQKNYQLQLYTTLFIEAGDFSSWVCEEEELEEVKDEISHSTDFHESKEQVLSEADHIGHTETLECSDSGLVKDAQKADNRGVKRKKDRGRDSIDMPQKRARSSQSSDAPSSPEASLICSQSNSETASSKSDSTSRLNGIDNMNSMISSSNPLSLPSAGEKPGLEASSFMSPARRSGRAHVPSKKKLDSLEDSPALAALKTFKPSSDDEMSGYSSEETVVKKGKKKTPLSSL